MKSTVEQIRARFDSDVERFSNLETGQTATIDAHLMMSLVAETSTAASPHARSLLDIGCGAGNYTLSVLKHRPNLNCTLVDLSEPMLTRAVERVSPATTGWVKPVQGDIREIELPCEAFGIAVAAMTLHHLRTDDEWKSVFRAVYRSLVPGGSFWIADITTHSNPAVQEVQWRRYGEYLVGLNGEAYRDHVWEYVEQEDTPRPLAWQLDLLANVGFSSVDVLHVNAGFAAFGGARL